MLGPKGALKPLTIAIVFSLLIHGGLLAVITVNSHLRQQAEAARVTASSNSSRVQFFVSGAEDDGGRVGSPTADNQAVPTQVEPPLPPIAPSSETPPPLSDAPAVSLTIDLAANQAAPASDQPPGNAPGGNAESGMSALPGNAASTARGTGGNCTSSGAGYGRNPLPPYPREAREQRWQGTVLLRVEVLADGSAGKTELAETSGYPVLDDVSLATVRDWKFQPAHTGSTPIPSIVEIPITFRLEH